MNWDNLLGYGFFAWLILTNSCAAYKSRQVVRNWLRPKIYDETLAGKVARSIAELIDTPVLLAYVDPERFREMMIEEIVQLIVR